MDFIGSFCCDFEFVV